VVKFKKNNYQDLPWNNTIEEDTFCYPDLFAGGKGINVWTQRNYDHLGIFTQRNYDNLKTFRRRNYNHLFIVIQLQYTTLKGLL
jgi:hypothetical protein